MPSAVILGCSMWQCYGDPRVVSRGFGASSTRRHGGTEKCQIRIATDEDRWTGTRRQGLCVRWYNQLRILRPWEARLATMLVWMVRIAKGALAILCVGVLVLWVCGDVVIAVSTLRPDSGGELLLHRSIQSTHDGMMFHSEWNWRAPVNEYLVGEARRRLERRAGF